MNRVPREIINEYVALDAQRDGNDVIWRLCELSCQVIEASEWGIGATEQLSKEAKVSVPTITRRRWAWVARKVFYDVATIVDLDTGQVLNDNNPEVTHDQIFAMLQGRYSYFSVMGQCYCKSEVTDIELVGWLAKCAREGWSVRELQARLQEIYPRQKSLDRVMQQFQSSAAEILTRGEELQEKGFSHFTDTARQVAQFEPHYLSDEYGIENNLPAVFPPHFSPREEEVRILMHKGLCRGEIALILGISPYTADQYWKSILQKLGTRSLFAAGGISQSIGVDPQLSLFVENALTEWHKGHRGKSDALMVKWEEEETAEIIEWLTT